MKRRIAAAAAAATGALVLPAAAPAHVTVQPTAAPAGAETVLAVRVPNERDDASTVKVDVKLPPGFVSASWEAVPGWKVRAVKQKLSKPVQTDDGPIDEQIGEIVWTASSAKAGTYSNGDVVRWIGASDADEPAPTLKLTAANAASGATPAPARPAPRPRRPQAPATTRRA